jgi:hypothetical protein
MKNMSLQALIPGSDAGNVLSRRELPFGGYLQIIGTNE